MRLFIPNEIETHLIEQHGVSADRIAATREQEKERGHATGTLSEASHRFMHQMTEFDHTH